LPVATDLRFIGSCIDIVYGFSRFGRYAYDIVEVLETIGHINECDKTAVLRMASTVREMILLSVHALQLRDKNASAKLYEMDDTVDALYSKYLHEVINTKKDQLQTDMDQRYNISCALFNTYTVIIL